MARSRGPWIASLAIHLALVLALLSQPARERAPDPYAELTPIELVELPAAPSGEAARGADDAEPATTEAPGAGDVVGRRGDSRRRAVAKPPAGDSPSNEPVPADPDKGLALHGLRSDPHTVPPPSITLHDHGHAGDRYGPEEATSDETFETPHEAGFRRNRKGELVHRERNDWTATLLPDGRVHFEDVLRPKLQADAEGNRRVVMPGLKELIPAARGFEFWQAEKRRLLQATREMRLRMAVELAEKNIDRQLAALYRDLLEIWQVEGESARSRRERIFERWDECVEALSVELGDFTDEEPSKIDAMRDDAGTKARARILEFVRRHLPAGSEDAYTTAELSELNERRASRERFDPYGDSE